VRRVVLVVLLIAAQAAAAKTVSREQLLDGVTIHKRKRMIVRDIRAGNVSVKHLFQPFHEQEPSTFEYYVKTASDSLTLRVAGPDHLQTLLETLALQHTTRLTIVLRDDRDTFLRGKWPFDDSYFNAVLEWTVLETPCEQITHIVYRKVRDSVREQLREGSTWRRVALNDVFDVLVHGDIDSYMRSLDPVRKKDPCFHTFELYQWLKGEQVAGFAFGEYELGEGMRGSLRPAADALLEMRRDWKRYRLQIRVTGYTDASRMEKKKELSASETGVEVAGPLDVRYRGCSSETLDGKAPLYISLGRHEGTSVGGKIANNCELGAVRAYVALAYFEQLLGHDGVDYEYATGGVHPEATKRDAAHRKLDIELEVRAGSAQE